MSQAACRTVVTDTSLASSARLLLGVTDDTFPLQSQIDSGMAAPAAGCTVELQADKLAVWWTEADIADAWTNPFKTVSMNSNLELVESGVEPLPGFNKYCMVRCQQPLDCIQWLIFLSFDWCSVLLSNLKIWRTSLHQSVREAKLQLRHHWQRHKCAAWAIDLLRAMRNALLE